MSYVKMNLHLEFQYPQVMQIGAYELAQKIPSFGTWTYGRVILSDETWDFPQVGFVGSLVNNCPSAWTLQIMAGVGQDGSKGVSAKDILHKKRHQIFKLCPNDKHHNLS